MFIVLVALCGLLVLIGLIRLFTKRKVILLSLGLLLSAGCIFLFITSFQFEKNKHLTDERSSLHWYITYQQTYMGGVQQEVLDRVATYNKSIEPYAKKWVMYKALMPWLKGNFEYLEVAGTTPGVEPIKKNAFLSFLESASNFFDSNKEKLMVFGKKEEVNQPVQQTGDITTQGVNAEVSQMNQQTQGGVSGSVSKGAGQPPVQDSQQQTQSSQQPVQNSQQQMPTNIADFDISVTDSAVIP